MGAEKFYRWERMAFPWHWKVKVAPDLRVPLTLWLARHWKIPIWGNVQLTTRGGGRGGIGIIKLPRAGYQCSLGLIIHELAHPYNTDRNGESVRSHGAKFRQGMIKLLCETRSFKLVKKAVEQIRKNREESFHKGKAIAIREEKRIARVQAAKAHRKSREFKIARLKDRAKKLRTRIKRLTTNLKSAERSLRAYEKSEKAAAAAAQEVRV